MDGYVCPDADGLVAADQRPEADVNIAFQSGSTMADGAHVDGGVAISSALRR
ncbi:MAG: hypothetical protein M3545_10820 [Acidobacteriota bacterium]|nr:hypothetical protein [Acidobacteriota bacterium]